MTWDQLAEMQASGLMGIGLHGRNHARVSTTTRDSIWDAINGGYCDILDSMDYAAKWYAPPYNDNADTAQAIAYRLFNKQFNQGYYNRVVNDDSPVLCPDHMEIPATPSANFNTALALFLDNILVKGNFVVGMVHNITDPDKYYRFLKTLLEYHIPILSPKALAYPTNNKFRDGCFSETLSDMYSTIKAEDGTIALDTDSVFVGKNSVKFYHPGSGAETQRMRTAYTEKLKAGDYRFSFWVNTDNDTDFNVRLGYQVMDERMNDGSLQDAFVINTNADTMDYWHCITDTLTLTSDRYLRFVVGLYNPSANPVTVYYDAIVVQRNETYHFNAIDTQ